MSPSSRTWQPWGHDEEMAKKDDDRPLPGHHPRPRANWTASRVPRRSRSWLKRITVYALVLAALFLLVTRGGTSHSRPGAEPPAQAPRDGRDYVERAYDDRFGQEAATSGNGPGPKPPRGRPKYDGPVRFPALLSSLRAASRTSGGARLRNRNVLFAAASLRSASTLLPMACEMAVEGRNSVHFAFMGVAAGVGVEDLHEMNGIDKDCRLVTHVYINSYLHPQAVIVDSTTQEEDYFLASARDQVLSKAAALIELPEPWNKVRFDILIHATPTRTANLKRLLGSIARADLAGINTPYITVELPGTVEPSLESFLSRFQWPRPTPRGGQPPPMISLRRRITRQPLDEEDSSVRFVESFWPTDPSRSHVLVLSPHTEVTPQFFQYVKYALLQQLHSNMALLDDYATSLMGLGLSIPHTLADGTTAFSPPAPEAGEKDTAFLWQRANSEAMLFTGQKWIELHHFISRTLSRKKTMSPPPPAALLTSQRTAGNKYPAWLEYALQLSRLRGYYTLYPGRATADAILGVHSDMPDPPEEYPKDAARKTTPRSSLEDESADRIDPVSPVDMLETLPAKGVLQSPVTLPLLAWDGTPATRTSLRRQALEYAALFRREVGGCAKEEDVQGARRSKADAADLFCVG
ncbi:hypothetical protein E4U41_002735 [Claviceps citrina]|nr:hypothetical protein E4U41_002735 [Claviceps citrina]